VQAGATNPALAAPQADGGAIYNLSHPAASGVPSATAATLALVNSILSGSVGGADLVTNQLAGAATATVFATAPNIVGSTKALGASVANTSGVNVANPNLDTVLRNNGGLTPTLALLPGSPAIDAGDDSVVSAPTNLTTDQRGIGFPRKSGLHVDLGAYEVVGLLAASPTPVNGFEFSQLSAAPLATFTQGSNAQPPGTYHVLSLDWGDGTPLDMTTGQVSQPGGSGTPYVITGTHTYTDESHQFGVYAVTVSVSDGTNSASITTTANILEELLPDGSRGTADQRFVSEVSRDLLGRQVDQGGLDFWTAQLPRLGRIGVVLGIESDGGHEFYIRVVAQLYRQFLKRSAAGDVAALGWVADLAGGATIEQVAAGIVNSPEYSAQRTNRSFDSWLDAFYSDVFHRAVDPSGRSTWNADFARVGSRQQVALDIFSSAPPPGQSANEYHTVLVFDSYRQFLDRSAAGDSGVPVWTSQLEGGDRDEAVIARIMGAPRLVEFYNKTVS
jgi:hypothetical protein